MEKTDLGHLQHSNVTYINWREYLLLVASHASLGKIQLHGHRYFQPLWRQIVFNQV